MKYTREQFYKSDTWLNFRKTVIHDRMDEQGFVYCADCGKAIVNKYDMILHHKTELTDANVNDAMISLNPELIEVVCFKCHNKEHDRFQGGNYTHGWKMPQKHVYIVYGSPCAGKSSWVREVAGENDLVVDMDSIWQMISINDRYIKPAGLKSVAFELRDKIYDIIKYRSGKWRNAFIITGGALKGDRDRLMQRVGADELIFIDTSEEECIKRMGSRFVDEEIKQRWIGFISDWFSKFQPE